MAWNNQKPQKHVTTTQRQKILKRDNHTCQQCGHQDPTGDTLQIDHRTNLKQGGTNHPTNLWTLCTWCHQHKTNKEKTIGQNRWKKPKPKHPGLK